VPRNDSAGRTASTAGVRGLVAGAVLRAIRRFLGETQEATAERLGVSPETIQSWESGRRALAASSYIELQRIRRMLSAAGVPSNLLTVWDQAHVADTVLDGIDVGDLSGHPLAYLVPARTLSELVAWPITGVAPRQLRDGKAPRGRRDRRISRRLVGRVRPVFRSGAARVPYSVKMPVRTSSAGKSTRPGGPLWAGSSPVAGQ
jgi:transcriptional regulator with XRE-family HTH domain